MSSSKPFVILAYSTCVVAALASVLFLYADIAILADLYNATSETYEIYSTLTITQEKVALGCFTAASATLLFFNVKCLLRKHFTASIYLSALLIALYGFQILFWTLTFKDPA